MIRLQAHRGVSTEYPENTVLALQKAVEQGYPLIECDPKYTADGTVVLLHDKTLNRTARRRDGQPMAENLAVKDLTWEDLRQYEFGSWKDEKFRGEPIPTLRNALEAVADTGVTVKIDNVWEKFPDEMAEKLFAEVEKTGERVKIGFTCAQPENLERIAKRFPNAELHYDGKDLSDETLKRVTEIALGHRLVIWVCYENAATAWFQGQKADAQLCKRVKTYGEMGIWILSKPEELAQAVLEFHADAVETTGSLKPSHLKILTER